MVVKIKLKVITVLIMSLFLVSIIAVGTPVKAVDSNRILMIDIMAKGIDADIGLVNPEHRATTLIVAKIKFDEVTGLFVGQVEFHTTIYDESGKKIYSMMGKLKNGMAMLLPFYPCPVREVMWTNLWFVTGEGRYKTTDVIIEDFEYRGSKITLPNTEGKYVTSPIVLLISPNGEYVGGVWPEGGWAFAGIPGFGGITYLTKYMEKWVP